MASFRRKRRRRKPIPASHEPASKKRRVSRDDEEEEMEYVPNFCVKSPEDLPPQMQNVVCVMDMKRNFDEVLVCQNIESSDYVRHKFAAMTVRLLRYATGLVYTTGKFIGVGTFSELATRLVGIMYMTEIGKVREREFVRGEDGRIKGFLFRPISNGIRSNEMHLVNTVFKFTVDSSTVHLDEIHRNTLEFSAFSPEAFPGVRIHGKSATFIVFQNGWCLILGLSNAEDSKKAAEEVRAYVEEAERTHQSSNVLSKYIWQRSLGVDPLKPTAKVQEKKKKKTVEEYSVWDRCGVDLGVFPSNPEDLCLPTSSYAAKGSENFERRLTEHYAWGSYVDAEDYATHVLTDKVRERVQLADFAKCLHRPVL